MHRQGNLNFYFWGENESTLSPVKHQKFILTRENSLRQACSFIRVAETFSRS